MNKKIIIATFIIGGSGIVNSWVHKKAITPVVIGSYVFLLVLALMDTLSPQLGQLAGAIAMLAALTVIITELPWGTILQAVKGGKK